MVFLLFLCEFLLLPFVSAGTRSQFYYLRYSSLTGTRIFGYPLTALVGIQWGKRETHGDSNEVGIKWGERRKRRKERRRNEERMMKEEWGREKKNAWRKRGEGKMSGARRKGGCGDGGVRKR